MVRIEIARDELPRALNPAMIDEFTRVFKALGFKFVTLDLEGFRSGSMNSLLPAEQISVARVKDGLAKHSTIFAPACASPPPASVDPLL